MSPENKQPDYEQSQQYPNQPYQDPRVELPYSPIPRPEVHLPDEELWLVRAAWGDAHLLAMHRERDMGYERIELLRELGRADTPEAALVSEAVKTTGMSIIARTFMLGIHANDSPPEDPFNWRPKAP